ncbi:hypothetical protein ACU635_29705 [[Actinomadura] parvosata]|uniref:hypothetical protein n=1 Tax=[Actinomadura] parvosata TaxID=1955412 RepID=UPI00406C12BD
MGILVGRFTAESDEAARRVMPGGPASAEVRYVDGKGWIDELGDLPAELSGRDRVRPDARPRNPVRGLPAPFSKSGLQVSRTAPARPPKRRARLSPSAGHSSVSTAVPSEPVP